MNANAGMKLIFLDARQTRSIDLAKQPTEVDSCVLGHPLNRERTETDLVRRIRKAERSR